MSTSRELRRQRREAERKARKAECHAAKAQAAVEAVAEAMAKPGNGFADPSRTASEPSTASGSVACSQDFASVPPHATPCAEATEHTTAADSLASPQAFRSRAEINRENAQRSTGPRSTMGKARSSQNAFKHGLYSTQLVMPGEDPAELDALKADLIAEHQPVNQTEHILVNEIAEHFWRLRRMRALEARVFTPENLDSCLESGLLALIQRTMASAERGLHKALTSLRQQRKERDRMQATRRAEETPESGFVSSKTGVAEDGSGFVPEFFVDECPLGPNFDDYEFIPAFPEQDENSLEEQPAAA